jgi:hypothetical protein
VELGQVADERQADAESAVAASTAALALSQPVEHVREDLRGDALPRIADDDLGVRTDPLQVHLHAAVPRREFDGVVEEVPHDLLEPSGIAGHEHRGPLEQRLDADAFRFGRVTDGLERVHDQLAQIYRLDDRGACGRSPLATCREDRRRA